MNKRLLKQALQTIYIRSILCKLQARQGYTDTLYKKCSIQQAKCVYFDYSKLYIHYGISYK